jgi:hypothetical protein
MYRKVFVAENANDLNVTLPLHYLHKGVEVIAFEVDSDSNTSDSQKRSASEAAVEFFKSIQIDMSDFQFDRDEANER